MSPSDEVQARPKVVFPVPEENPRVAELDCRLLVHDRFGRVLLARYGDAELDGEWMLPGGPVLCDEPIDLAAARVLHEQLGVLVWPHGIVSLHEAAPQRAAGDALTIVYAASIISGEAVSQSCGWGAAFCWFPVNELPDGMSKDVVVARAGRGGIARCSRHRPSG